MANTNRPDGFRPIRHLNGSPFNGQTTKYTTATNSAAIYPGDLVTFNSVGLVKLATAGITTVLGAMTSRDPDRDNLTRKHIPVNTKTTIHVADSPDIVYEVQMAATAAAPGSQPTIIGKNVDIIAATGDETAGRSRQTTATAFASGTAQLRVIGVIDRADNSATDTSARLAVLINESAYKGTVGN